jgi:hypothetical protein
MTRLYYIFYIFQQKISVYFQSFFFFLTPHQVYITFSYSSIIFFSLSTVQILPCMDKKKHQQQRNLTSEFRIKFKHAITFGDIFFTHKTPFIYYFIFSFVPYNIFSQIVSLFLSFCSTELRTHIFFGVSKKKLLKNKF